MVSTWEQLGMLRLSGRKPSLPVIVTTNRHLPWNLSGVGAMTVLHESGKPLPVGLLDGLDVLLVFENCDQAGKVNRLMRTKGFAWRSCSAYCKCEQRLTTCCGPCVETREIDKELGGVRASK
jgi:hypothetical protein